MITLESHSPEESEQIASYLARFFIENKTSFKQENPTIITLEGDLGAGKTLFTRSFIHTLSASFHPERKPPLVSSPTYNILNHYPLSDISITHMDCYRLTHEEELDNIGLRDYLAQPGIIIVEWASKTDYFEKNSHIDITFTYNFDKRRLQFNISDFYPQYKQYLNQWLLSYVTK